MYKITKVTLEEFVQQAQQAEHVFVRNLIPGNRTQFTCLVDKEIYEHERHNNDHPYAPNAAKEAANLGKPVGHGIIRVSRNDELYLRWGVDEQPDNLSRSVIARRQQLQANYKDWLATFRGLSNPRILYLANGTVDVHGKQGRRLIRLMGYGIHDVVVDAVQGNKHHVISLDSRTFTDTQKAAPGNYIDQWPLLRLMVSTGEAMPGKVKVGLEKVPSKARDTLKDWYLMVYHSVDSLPTEDDPNLYK